MYQQAYGSADHRLFLIMNRNVFIIIPAYNAEKTLASVLDRIPASAQHRIACCVILNDGSRDDTQVVAERLADGRDDLVVLQHAVNRGYGATEIDLLNYAYEHGADIVAMLHADGQYSPEKLPDILAVFDEQDADIVQGSRMLGGGALEGGMPMYKFIANKCLTFIENTAFRMDMAEFHSGYMCYSRRFLESVPYAQLSASFDFDLEMLALAHVGGFKIREVAIPTIYAHEDSHLNPVTYGLRVLRVVGRHLSGHYQRLLQESSRREEDPSG